MSHRLTDAYVVDAVIEVVLYFVEVALIFIYLVRDVALADPVHVFGRDVKRPITASRVRSLLPRSYGSPPGASLHPPV